MNNTKLSLSTPCPSCHSQLKPKVLYCEGCGTEVKGPVDVSPFMKLDEEMSHFLTVFIYCGGKIGDVEKALGVSYPTVKAKLARLKKLVCVEDYAVDKAENEVMDILNKVQKGELSHEEAVSKIYQIKKGK